MPEPITHIGAAAGTVAGAIAFVFDVPSATVFAAFSGACFGVALSPSGSFWRALLLIFAGTVAAGYATPLALHFLGDTPQRGVAFFLSLGVIWDTSRAWMFDAARRGVGRLFGGAA